MQKILLLGSANLIGLLNCLSLYQNDKKFNTLYNTGHNHINLQFLYSSTTTLKLTENTVNYYLFSIRIYVNKNGSYKTNSSKTGKKTDL